MIELFIFDLDGVLLDSESLYKKLNFQLFKELEVEITDEEYNSFIGISGDRMWGYIKEKGNLPQSVQELRVLERECKYGGLLSTTLTSNPGLFTLLYHLKANSIPCCIASSGLIKNIRLILDKLEAESYFQYIISGEMPKKGKPAPDIFLLAASHFDVSPENCVVIEDSRNGTLAAKAAGMKCIGYINEGSGNQDLSMADFVVDYLSDKRVLELVNQ